MISGNYIYEHQALAILERAQENSRILRRLQLIEPKWIHAYLTDLEWNIHTDYSHWQFTYPEVGKSTYKPYTCFTLKKEKKDATADKVWNAIHSLARYHKCTMDEIIDKVMSYATAIERLASLGDK